MGRPIYPYELSDPDFSWLISNFLETNPEYTAIESTCLPVVFVSAGDPAFFDESLPYPPAVIEEDDQSDAREE